MEASTAVSPFDDLSIHHRVLGWIGPHPDRIGNQIFARNTPIGLAAHLTDDPNTPGDTSIEAVVGYLKDLVDAGLVVRSDDGTYARTPTALEIGGGIVYAEAHAAGLVEPLEDGSGYRRVGESVAPVQPAVVDTSPPQAS